MSKSSASGPLGAPGQRRGAHPVPGPSRPGSGPAEALPLWRLVWAKVRADQVPLKAAALSFHLLFSLLPMMAILLAVLSGPAFEKGREEILDQVARHLLPSPLGNEEPLYGPPLLPGLRPEGDAEQEAALWASQQHRVFVEKLKNDLRGTIALVSNNVRKISVFSFLLLLFVVAKLFNTIEETFNGIWRVQANRPFFSRVAVITALVFWGPVILSLSVALLARLPQWWLLSGYLLPVLFTSLAFAAFFMVLPFAKVELRAALAAGAATALAWELSKVGFLFYLRYAVGMSALYGSLSVVPIVFLWVYLTWLIILAGAQLAYVIQHRQAMVRTWLPGMGRPPLGDGPAPDPQAPESPVLVAATALAVLHAFRAGQHPAGVPLSALAESLRHEPSGVRSALGRLRDLGVVVCVAGQDPPAQAEAEDPRFLPAADPSAIPLARLFSPVSSVPPRREGPLWTRATALCEAWRHAGNRALGNRSLGEWLAEESSSDEPPVTSGKE